MSPAINIIEHASGLDNFLPTEQRSWKDSHKQRILFFCHVHRPGLAVVSNACSFRLYNMKETKTRR